MRCRDLHERANPPYLSRFLFCALPRVAPYCVRCGVKVVSKWCQKFVDYTSPVPLSSASESEWEGPTRNRSSSRSATAATCITVEVCIFINAEPRGVEPLNSAEQRLRLHIVGSRGWQWRVVCIRLAYRRAWGCAGTYEATGPSTQDRTARPATPRE